MLGFHDLEVESIVLDLVLAEILGPGGKNRNGRQDSGCNE